MLSVMLSFVSYLLTYFLSCVCVGFAIICIRINRPISFLIVARSISDDLSSGDAARFRDDEYGKSEIGGGMGASSSARNESAHKGERDKEKKDKEKEDRDEGTHTHTLTHTHTHA